MTIRRARIGRGFYILVGSLKFEAEFVSRREWTLALWHRRDAQGRGFHWFNFGPGVIPF